jgi:hypothetical protein
MRSPPIVPPMSRPPSNSPGSTICAMVLRRRSDQ